MRQQSFKLTLALTSLVVSIIVAVSFYLWMTVEQEYELAARTASEYTDFTNTGEIEAAKNLINSRLGLGSQEPLNPVWLSFISKVSNPYTQLELYERVLKFAPKNKDTYYLISDLLLTAPPDLTEVISGKFLEEAKKIDGVDIELLNELIEKAGEDD